MDKSKLLVIDGGTVKTGENGIVSGMGIVFGSPEQPDRSPQKDFFTKETYIRKKESFNVPLYYNHGIGPIREEVGEATLTKTVDGWQATANLDLSTESGQKVYEYVKDTPHGFSSGALSHLVKREAKANNSHFLSRWVVGELSLTERPAERKAVVYNVKSVDGETVYEPEFEESSMVITFYDKDGSVVWNNSDPSNKDFKNLAEIKPVRIEFKYMGGSASYSIYHQDEKTGVTQEMAMQESGDIEGMLQKMQDMINKAKVSSSNKSDNENVTIRLGLDEEKIKEIVKSVLAEQEAVKEPEVDNGEGVSTEPEAEATEAEVSDAVEELAETKQKLADAEERIAQLEILADAKKTIDNYKGK